MAKMKKVKTQSRAQEKLTIHNCTDSWAQHSIFWADDFEHIKMKLLIWVKPTGKTEKRPKTGKLELLRVKTNLKNSGPQ